MWAQSEVWVEGYQTENSSKVNFFKVNVLDLTEELDGLLKGPTLVDVIMGMWNDFLDYLCHHYGELSAFWKSYICRKLAAWLITFFL